MRETIGFRAFLTQSSAGSLGTAHSHAYQDKQRAVENLFGIPAKNTGTEACEAEDTVLGAHYILHIVGDVDPDLHGPYPSEAVRDETARRIKVTCGDEDGLYRLDLDIKGHPVVAPYTAAELDAGQAAA